VIAVIGSPNELDRTAQRTWRKVRIRVERSSSRVFIYSSSIVVKRIRSSQHRRVGYRMLFMTVPMTAILLKAKGDACASPC